MPATVTGRSTDALLGALFNALGKSDEAVKHYRDAAKFCSERFIPELAWIKYEYAKVLCERSGQRDKELALENADVGLEIANRLSMHPLIEKIDQLKNTLSGTSKAFPDGLSDREVEVLLKLSQGFTNQEIAEKLFISHRTVAQHVQNIFHKTGMANRAEATAYAFRKGLIS